MVTILTVVYNLTQKLSYLLNKAGKKGLVIACIGTDLVSGDCLGPVLGQLLIESDTPAYVYGSLNYPINALNADEYNRFIKAKHADCVVLAIDSCVGNAVDLGKISIRSGPLLPAAAAGKKLIGFGDISLTAITASCMPNEKAFSRVRLGFVYGLAKIIAKIIADCFTQEIFYTKNAGFAMPYAVFNH